MNKMEKVQNPVIDPCKRRIGGYQMDKDTRERIKSKKKEMIKRRTNDEYDDPDFFDVTEDIFSRINPDHSETSSNCSFDPHPIARHNCLPSDKNYNVRIEKMFPRELRRKKYEKPTDDVSKKRKKHLQDIQTRLKKKPKSLRKIKGIRTYVKSLTKKKLNVKKTNVEKSKKAFILRHPWINMFTRQEILNLSGSARKSRIREYYYDIINDPNLTERITERPDLGKFTQWYNRIREGLEEESDVDDDDLKLVIEPEKIKLERGELQRLQRVRDKRKHVLGKKIMLPRARLNYDDSSSESSQNSENSQSLSLIHI